jgi:hypothetical protein
MALASTPGSIVETKRSDNEPSEQEKWLARHIPHRLRVCLAYSDKIAASGWTWCYCRTAPRYGWRYIVDAHCGDVSGFR